MQGQGQDQWCGDGVTRYRDMAGGRGEGTRGQTGPPGPGLDPSKPRGHRLPIPPSLPTLALSKNQSWKEQHTQDSFNCFFNLKIKEQQRHLQGDACFMKGLCSQQAQGWSGVAGWALEYFPGVLPRVLTLVS